MFPFISVGSLKQMDLSVSDSGSSSERTNNKLTRALRILFIVFESLLSTFHGLISVSLSTLSLPVSELSAKCDDCSGAGPPGPPWVPPAAWSNKTINCVHFKYQAGDGAGGERGECTRVRAAGCGPGQRRCMQSPPLLRQLCRPPPANLTSSACISAKCWQA